MNATEGITVGLRIYHPVHGITLIKQLGAGRTALSPLKLIRELQFGAAGGSSVLTKKIHQSS